MVIANWTGLKFGCDWVAFTEKVFAGKRLLFPKPDFFESDNKLLLCYLDMFPYFDAICFKSLNFFGLKFHWAFDFLIVVGVVSILNLTCLLEALASWRAFTSWLGLWGLSIRITLNCTWFLGKDDCKFSC